MLPWEAQDGEPWRLSFALATAFSDAEALPDESARPRTQALFFRLGSHQRSKLAARSEHLNAHGQAAPAFGPDVERVRWFRFASGHLGQHFFGFFLAIVSSGLRGDGSVPDVPAPALHTKVGVQRLGIFPVVLEPVQLPNVRLGFPLARMSHLPATAGEHFLRPPRHISSRVRV
jgi:hypothetical protein